MIGEMILMNQSGDVTITWTREYELEMRKLIQKKIAEGYTFFILKPLILGLTRKEKVKSIADVKIGSKLLLSDEDAVRLFNDGKISAKPTEDTKHEALHSSKDVDEIVNNRSLAIRPIAGG